MPSSKYQLQDERELFKQMAKDDVQAFTTIFNHYNQVIYPVVLRIMKNEEAAEEIVQDVFLKLWQNRTTFTDIENHKAFLFRMASNKTLDALKKLSREKGMLMLLQQKANQQKQDNTNQLLDFKDSERLVNTAIDQLPSQRKLIYKLSRNTGLSHKEIAERLNISHNTVRNQLIEALKFIRSFLTKMAG
jgi:RNA polymerase sigma-70 factor (family 1)